MSRLTLAHAIALAALFAAAPALPGCSDDPAPAADSKVRDLSTLEMFPPDSGTVDRPLPSETSLPDLSPVPDKSSSCKHPAVTKQCAEGFCFIPAGCFSMGSPSSEACRPASGSDDNEVLHEVTLSHGFEISEKEVTQGEFETLMGYNTAFFTQWGASNAVEHVTWSEAAAYCNALSTKKGLANCYTCSGAKETVACEVATAYAADKIYACPGYRLPTDAEWEYAYRAGTSTPYYNGAPAVCSGPDTTADAIAWYFGNTSDARPRNGGKKAANNWGLYDMAGNVWEWVHDSYQVDLGAAPATDPVVGPTGTSRIVRGGAYSSQPERLRGAYRYKQSTTSEYGTHGFRVVVTE